MANEIYDRLGYIFIFFPFLSVAPGLFFSNEMRQLRDLDRCCGRDRFRRLPNAAQNSNIALYQ